jgi:predicted Mrr-cat superfamily restriction endonuclease
MRLFQMKAEVNGRNRMDDFLEHNYVCAGPAGIGDLEHCEEAELENRLANVARDERQRAAISAEMLLFVRVMQDGDYVIMKDNDNVYLGDIGDYYYVDAFDSEEEGSCHRRGVTWLMTVPEEGIGSEMRALLNEEANLSAFGRTISQAELRSELGERNATSVAEANPEHPHGLPLPDAGMITEALAILHAAMQSEDPERRERAAIAVLEYAKGRTLGYKEP